MKRLKIGILDFLTNTPNEPWFQRHVMLPNYSAIMPQCVAVWAEELGHQVFYETYTSREDLFSCLPDDLDVLFLACFSRTSFLAYAVSEMFRKKGVVTVLGGPHARSFVAHSRRYFDYLCQITDKETILSILQDPQHHTPAVVLNAKSQPTELPGVRARGKYIDYNIRKGWSRFKTVPVIGSLGCPYTCHFCIDAPIPYRTLPYDTIVDDLQYVKQRWGSEPGHLFVIWHDPNFGVRFNEYMQVIERSNTGLMHIAESSMSLLREENLKALKRNNFIGILPGIESWYGFNAKGGQKRNQGMEKVKSVSEHINLIQSYIPYIQANFVLGLDSDAGAEPWDLTKEFMRRSPGAFPGFSLVTDFQNSPLSFQLHQEGRTVPLPYPFLDNNFSMNVKLKNYTPVEFYDRMIDLYQELWSWKTLARRFAANNHLVIKLINFGRGVTEGRNRMRHHHFMREKLATDPEFIRFFSGESPNPPQFYFDTLMRQLGKYSVLLPDELKTAEGWVESVREVMPSEKAIPQEKTETVPEVAVA